MANLLAFDTATDRIVVAVSAGGRAWTGEGEGWAAASTALLPIVHRLLADAGLRLADLDAIAYGRGPGAFTGLRTACSIAQGLAFGAGRPVLPIDTLLIVAEDARDGAVDCNAWVALDARMCEIYAARYVHSAGAWRTAVAPALWTAQRLQAEIAASPCTVLAGNAIDLPGAAIDAGAAQRRPLARPRAAALPVLAEAAWQRGEARDAAEAVPLYVRDKVALTTVERQALRGAEAAA